MGGLKKHRCEYSFPLRLLLHYSSVYDPPEYKGVGHTIGIGPSTVHFLAEQPIAVGRRIKLLIEWPARLDGSVPLQLIIVGRITQSSDADAMLDVEKHEFRTRRGRPWRLLEGETPAQGLGVTS